MRRIRTRLVVEPSDRPARRRIDRDVATWTFYRARRMGICEPLPIMETLIRELAQLDQAITVGLAVVLSGNLARYVAESL